MDSNDEVTDIAGKVVLIERTRDYKSYPLLMLEIIKKDNYLSIIAELAGRLPNILFKNLLLGGLNHLIKLKYSDLQMLFKMCCNNYTAIYNLTAFFVQVGNARGKVLQNLSDNFAGISDIPLFSNAMKDFSLEDETDTIIIMNNFSDFKVSSEDISEFRRKLLEQR